MGSENEWQGVFTGPEGFVNVRSHKNMDSDVIGTKPTCAIFKGRRDDKWVALLGEPGYVRIALKEQRKPDARLVLLRQRTVSYEKISSGVCEDVGKYPIVDG